MATPLLIEVLTASGCSRCQQIKDLAKRLISEHPEGLFEYREVNVVEEIDYAVSLGVLSTPAVAIDGVLSFTSEKKLRKALLDSLRPLSSDKENT